MFRHGMDFTAWHGFVVMAIASEGLVGGNYGRDINVFSCLPQQVKL